MRRMLLLDDDADFRRILSRSMQKRGFDCLEAADAAAALTILQSHPVTHAVLDLNLGGGDSGLEVLRQLMQLRPNCRAVVLTGFASIATAVEATKSGAVQYLPKPASADEIITALADDTAVSPAIPETLITPERLEWEYIQRVLLKNDGNISVTARELNMHRRTLQRKLAKRPPR